MARELTERDKNFLRNLKAQGVNAQDAFVRLDKVKVQIGEPISPTEESPEEKGFVRKTIEAIPPSQIDIEVEKAKEEGTGAVGVGLAAGKGLAKGIGKGILGAITGAPQATGEVLDFVARGVELGFSPIDTVSALAKGDLESLPQRGAITQATRGFAEFMGALSDFFQTSLGLDPNDAAVQAGELLSPTLGEFAVLARGTKAAAKVAGGLRRGAEKNIERVLAPTKEFAKVKTAKVLPELAPQAPVAASRASFLAKAEQNVEKFGQEIDQFVKSGKLTGGIPKKDLINLFEETKDRFKVGGIVVEDTPIKILDNLIATVDQFGNKLSPEDTLQLRRVWDTVVEESKGFQKTLKEGSEIKFKKEASNLIRGELAKANPELAKINKHFTLWANTAEIVEETSKRKIGQTGGLKREIFTIGGAAIGSKAGGIVGTAVGATAGRKLADLFSSTAWNTVSAKIKTKLADAIVGKNSKEINNIITKILKSSEFKRAAIVTAPIRQED